jgi:aerobic carbon-monoxide dehydrogenase large subunit
MNEQIKFPAGTAFAAIGHPLRRKEDARLLTGKGRFSDDFNIEGQTYAAMVRSPRSSAAMAERVHLS